MNLSPPAHLIYCFVVASLVGATGRIGSDTLREAVVRILGSVAFRLSSEKREDARAGLHAFFGDSKQGQDLIVRESFRFFWEELFWLSPTRRERRLARDAAIRGIDHLKSALDQGKGAILIESNSFGYRSAAKQVLRRSGYSMAQIHAESHLGGLRNRAPAGGASREKIRNIFESWERRFIDEFVYIPSEPNLAYGRTLKTNARRESDHLQRR